MNLHSFRVKNFRRLKDVHVELERDISIFVGANNSGKTSATHAIQLFMKCSKDEFSIYDFSADCWSALDSLGDRFGMEAEGAEPLQFPIISLDLWFGVQLTDLHRVIDILPSLEWEGAFVGLRIAFCPSNPADLIARFREARAKAAENAEEDEAGNIKYHPWPQTLTEYLTERLVQEFELRYYVLDHSRFDLNFREPAGYLPPQLTPDKGRSGAQIIGNLLRVDCLGAQRHLSDAASGGRSEDLSRCLSRFYSRNLQQRENDYPALRALADSETKLNEHLATVFEQTLGKLSNLGYPGLTNPRLLIKSALNPAAIMSSQEGARVHYALADPGEALAVLTLPDRYNGLGFKNLIYMVVELLDLHARWLESEEDRPPLHLIFVEEPEAHLHAQLQQVFIREILDLIALEEEDGDNFSSQLVITTHSPHILYERGFKPIRYFRRVSSPGVLTSEVLNLSGFYKSFAEADAPARDFLERYMKLSHCDLFFADAAILVEGNVERLLMPLMITRAADRLSSTYLSILEIGGAFGYRFKSLIEFLGITALIVTDIDSVLPGAPEADAPQDDDEEEQNEEDADGAGKACPVNFAGSVTSNRTLIEWLPKKTTIDDLIAATEAERTQEPTASSRARIRVAYQTRVTTTWNGVTAQLAGRTLEEAFALENLVWCQHLDRKALKLRIPKNEQKTLPDLSERIFKRVKSAGFKKTDFALALLAESPNDWVVPQYIADGLNWLADQVVESEEEPAPALPPDVPIPAPVGALPV